MRGILWGIMSIGGRAEEDLATLGWRRGETRVRERLDGNVETELGAGGKGIVRGITVSMGGVERRVQ